MELIMSIVTFIILVLLYMFFSRKQKYFICSQVLKFSMLSIGLILSLVELRDPISVELLVRIIVFLMAVFTLEAVDIIGEIKEHSKNEMNNSHPDNLVERIEKLEENYNKNTKNN